MIEILERQGLKGHRFFVSKVPQIYGACLHCANLCGVENELFMDKFKNNYLEFSGTNKQ